LLGIYKEIFIEISKMTSDTFEFDYGSAAHCIKQFNEGKLDIEPGINPVWRHAEKVSGLYSIPFAKATTVLVGLKPSGEKNKQQKIATPKKEKKLKIGLVRGYPYPSLSTYFSEGAWIPVFADNELALIALLKQKKVDQIVIQSLVMDFFIHSTDKKSADRYLISKPIETQDIMLRVHPDKASAIPRFNEAIKKLLDSGAIKKIYNHYGLDEAAP
ncbi:MAG: hypothetical protein RLZ35_57, partial [Pseudomonadota bacterium]